MRFFTFAVLSLSLLVSCTREKEYLPGELEYDKSVEAAEALIGSIAVGDALLEESCGRMSRYYDQGITAFKRLMPSLKGLPLTKRDMRLGAIREFVEKNC
jgi:hypothetical protein